LSSRALTYSVRSRSAGRCAEIVGAASHAATRHVAVMRIRRRVMYVKTLYFARGW
jgi:hypothetical protein